MSPGEGLRKTADNMQELHPQLRNAGFEQVYNLRGGILAWQNANLPTSRKK